MLHDSHIMQLKKLENEDLTDREFYEKAIQNIIQYVMYSQILTYLLPQYTCTRIHTNIMEKNK